MRTRTLLVAALLAAPVAGMAAGCSATSDVDVPDGAPTPPSKEDASEFTTTGARSWYLVGDAVTPGNDTLELEIAGPSSASVVDLWIDRHYAKRAYKSAGTWTFAVDISDLPPGDHEALLAADGDAYAFAAVDFKRSHPLYVAVSNDWDTGDHTDDKLERQDRLHAHHPELVITHFVGPYTFTDPTVSASRAKYLVNWVKNYQQTQGDEIGLHIHPYCNFITTAGVTCRTSPSFAKASDPTGYTVILGSYTRAELDKIFAKATELFLANGLPAPTSFRAGGWTTTLDVMKALSGAGHVIDASGANWARLEEWEFVAGAQLYAWNRENWMPIDETSQPYYPSTTDLLADAAPHVDILEVPDNGAMVDYVSANEMIEMFEANYKPGEALAETRHYSIGYHPVDFSEDFFTRIDTALYEIDKHLAANDGGPVVYARMSDLPKVFPQP
jgi:hypothetical protein